jgi:hypothetical protein
MRSPPQAKRKILLPRTPKSSWRLHAVFPLPTRSRPCPNRIDSGFFFRPNFKPRAAENSALLECGAPAPHWTRRRCWHLPSCAARFCVKGDGETTEEPDLCQVGSPASRLHIDPQLMASMPQNRHILAALKPHQYIAAKTAALQNSRPSSVWLGRFWPIYRHQKKPEGVILLPMNCGFRAPRTGATPSKRNQK